MEHSIPFIQALTHQCPDIPVRQNVPLLDLTSFCIGGPAEILLQPQTPEQLAACLQQCSRFQYSPVILGSGTNVLAPDEGLPGVVIRTRSLNKIRRNPDGTITAQSGATLARLAGFALEQSLTGLEFAQGIPGTVGGGLMMNAGAYDGQMSLVCVSACICEPDGSIKTLQGAQLGFGYRTSAFQQRSCAILSGTFFLQQGDSIQIRRKMEAFAQKRRESQPLEFPSAGSTFKRPAGGYAAALIDQAGLKGLRVGGAQVSTKHAGFVINLGGATAADVLGLIDRIRESVFKSSGVLLEPEICILQPEPCGRTLAEGV